MFQAAFTRQAFGRILAPTHVDITFPDKFRKSVEVNGTFNLYDVQKAINTHLGISPAIDVDSRPDPGSRIDQALRLTSTLTGAISLSGDYWDRHMIGTLDLEMLSIAYMDPELARLGTDMFFPKREALVFNVVVCNDAYPEADNTIAVRTNPQEAEAIASALRRSIASGTSSFATCDVVKVVPKPLDGVPLVYKDLYPSPANT